MLKLSYKALGALAIVYLFFGVSLIWAGERPIKLVEDQCSELKIGEGRVNTTRIVGAPFLIIRASKRKYIAHINPRYVRVAFNRISGTVDVLEDLEFQNLAKKCINLSSNFLLGPKREALEIKFTDQVGSYIIPEVEVELTSNEHRSDSRKYQDSIDCPTVLHETLHLLGLVDEYQEQITGFYKRYDDMWEYLDGRPNWQYSGFKSEYSCRSIGYFRSIMNNQWDAWKHSFRDNEHISSLAGVDLEELEEMEIDNLTWEGIIPSLLMPIHFDAIVNSGCSSEDRVYHSCSKNAYLRNKAIMWRGLIESECPQKPQICHNYDWVFESR